MRLCIIDPAHNVPGLTRVFPEAAYYAHEPDGFFNYTWTQHMTNSDFERQYGFRYRTDWDTITSANYDHVFIVFTVYDAYGRKPYQHDIARAMLDRIYALIRAQTFKSVALFDTHDYPYDPNVYPDQPVDVFFKRHYSTTRSYKPNVFPFPLSMFGRPCVMWSLLDYIARPPSSPFQKRKDAVWIGGTYRHVHEEEGIVRDRAASHLQIHNHIVSYLSLPHEEYHRVLNTHAICVDLIGVGDPNKRTFEIFSSGSLWMSNIQDLTWGFEEGDHFSDLCIFSDGDDFLKKKTALLGNQDTYQSALQQQETLIRKYFNKDALRHYIIQRIGYDSNNAL
jgi:hypothetical protein